MKQTPTALERACLAAGSQTQLGKLLNRKKAAVSRWKREQVPAEVCPDIERLTGVLCEELRPDVTWVRVKDKNWPNPQGRPLMDVAERRVSAKPAKTYPEVERRTGPADRRVAH